MPDRRILLAMLVAAFTSFEGSLLITTFLQLQSADETLKALLQHLLMQQSLALMMILPGRMLGKSNTMMREAVCVEKRLCIFLDWLSSGAPWHAHMMFPRPWWET